MSSLLLSRQEIQWIVQSVVDESDNEMTVEDFNGAVTHCEDVDEVSTVLENAVAEKVNSNSFMNNLICSKYVEQQAVVFDAFGAPAEGYTYEWTVK